MNSLLQTLFMTRELRKQLYDWQFEETEDCKREESIPYQLQELFGRLQLTQQSVVDTKGLIKSFGWDSKQTFIQNDVQEFCRVLLDAIERSLCRSSFISSLFQGLLIDYVRYQSCHTESHREDQFLDLSLAIHSHSDNLSYNSLEKALDAFIRPETLTGSNQYYCSLCCRKTDAVKGLRFKSFPRVLMVQLKRFDLDMETMRRRKIEDYVEFPMEVDLGKYVVGKWGRREEGGMKCKEGTRMAYMLNPNFRPLSPGSDHSSLSPASMPPSPSLYSLYSVLVHSGSLAGGHYYAFIKSFEDNHWYRFNDSQVTKASESDVKSTYGGKDGLAYLLVYQNKGEETGRVEDREVPEAVISVVNEEKRKGKERRAEELARARLVTVRIFYKGHEQSLEFSRSQPISSLYPLVQANFHIHASIRLRKYQPFHGTATEVLSDAATLEGVGMGTGYGALVVEERGEDGAFVEFRQGDFELMVVPWREKVCESPLFTYAEKTSSPVLIPTNLSTVWSSLLSELHLSLFPSSASILVQRRTYLGSGLEVLTPTTDLDTVRDLRLSESSVLLIEPWEAGSDHLVSKWLTEVQLDAYRTEVRFNPLGEGEGRSIRELRMRVLVDIRGTVGMLKLAVAETIGADVSDFIMRKGLSRAGAELKDDSQALGQAGLSLTSAVYIERGMYLPVEHVRVSVSLISPPSPRFGPTAMVSIWEICSITVHWSTPISAVTDMVISESRKRYPTLILPKNRLYLRNIAQGKPGSVLLSANPIGTGPNEGEKLIGMQVMEEEAGEWSPNMLILGVRGITEEEGLGKMRYIAVDKAWNTQQLGTFLSNLYSIPPADLLLQPIPSPSLFQLADLHLDPWLSLQGHAEAITSPPLSLYSDAFFIIRDKSKPLKANFSSFSGPERPLVIRLKGE